MSAVDKIFRRSEVAILNAGHADSARVLSGEAAGASFRCRLDVESVLDHDSPTGPDPREQSVMRILDAPDGLQVNDLVQVGEVVWKLVQREDNPGSITTDFWTEKQV